VDLSAEDTRRLLDGQWRPEHLMMTALGRSLSTWTSSRTILVDVLSHGRDAASDDINLSRTLGFMFSYNPLVLSHPTWDPNPDTLRAVTDQIGATPEGFSFELLRFRAPDADLRERLDALPRAEVLFVYDPSDGREHTPASWPAAMESKGPIASPRGIRQYPLRVGATMTPDLRLTFVYSAALHSASTIESIADEVAATMSSLLRRPSPIPG
jgi:hypothetical protein